MATPLLENLLAVHQHGDAQVRQIEIRPVGDLLAEHQPAIDGAIGKLLQTRPAARVAITARHDLDGRRHGNGLRHLSARVRPVGGWQISDKTEGDLALDSEMRHLGLGHLRRARADHRRKDQPARRFARRAAYLEAAHLLADKRSNPILDRMRLGHRRRHHRQRIDQHPAPACLGEKLCCGFDFGFGHGVGSL